MFFLSDIENLRRGLLTRSVTDIYMEEAKPFKNKY